MVDEQNIKNINNMMKMCHYIFTAQSPGVIQCLLIRFSHYCAAASCLDFEHMSMCLCAVPEIRLRHAGC